MTDKSGITENKIQWWKEWWVSNILISDIEPPTPTLLKQSTHRSSLLVSGLAVAGRVGRPSVGMPSRSGTVSSSSSWPGTAKWTLLKDGGGGSTGSEAARSPATVALRDTWPWARGGAEEEEEGSAGSPEGGGRGRLGTASPASPPVLSRVFLSANNQKQNYL